MPVKERRFGASVVLAPRGYLVGGEETEDLEQAIQALADEGVKHLVVDMSGVQHINSTALGVLISGHSSFIRRGGQFQLTGVDPRIQNIFVITKLSLVFEVYATLDQALASLAESEPGPAAPAE